jgi:hypothetical protein
MNSKRFTLEKELKSLRARLAASAVQYDQGRAEAAQTLAIDIRTIFHNPTGSLSLFNQLQLKHNVFMLSTTGQYIPGYSLKYFGLVKETSMKDTEANQETKKPDGYLPLCKVDKDFTNKWHIADDWWNELVLSSKVFSLSRKDLVLLIANQIEGVYLDGDNGDEHIGLKSGSEGWTCSRDGEEDVTVTYNSAYATMRQIVFEILKSFEYFDKIKSYNRRADINLNALYLKDILYFAPFECEKYSGSAEALVDKRVTKIEKRDVYFDSLIFHDGSKNGRIIAM